MTTKSAESQHVSPETCMKSATAVYSCSDDLPNFRISDILFKQVLGGIATRRQPNTVSATLPL